MLRLRADARRSRQFDDHRLFLSLRLRSVLVAQIILHEVSRNGTEPAFFLICATQRIFFKQMGKKTLDEILRFGSNGSRSRKKV